MRIGDDVLHAAQTSLSPVVMPRTSRGPPVFTPTATMTAAETIRWSRRTLM